MLELNYNEATKISPTSIRWRVPNWVSGGEHISRPGCICDQPR